MKKDLVEVQPAEPPSDALWQPFVGDAALRIINAQEKLSQQERDVLKNESLSILSRCIPPTAPDSHRSGLVVGNIQSGKTLSFATVAALAQDNSYRLVIVITGTTKILNSQSVKRLKQLLGISERGLFAWRLLQNPKATQSEDIKPLLEYWRTPDSSDLHQKTLMITVLKNATRLRQLAALLNKLDLRQIPTLMIDDEADQAGLNIAVKQGSESATYRELISIRNALPHHTYLGYTATPQAPLLINVMDVLSARFVQILTPGTEYTGGKQFFDTPLLMQIIPDSQIPSKSNVLQAPPESMQNALRIFFIGVAAGYLQSASQQENLGNRSMLIHPSQFTIDHLLFLQWVRQLQSSWSLCLGSDDASDDYDRRELVLDFRRAHADLAKTASGTPGFDQILPRLREAMQLTSIHEINRRQAASQFSGFDDIDDFWASGYAHILIGGQALERGFTVEGLTITYMPRGLGGGQADTVQQRARFYGYNKKHLGYCRVYLDRKSNDAYRAYIDHEDRLRESLAEHADTGKPLSEWRRVFFMDAALKPTRDNVLDIEYSRGAKANTPYDAMPPIYSMDDLEENRRSVGDFIESLRFIKTDTDLPPSQSHKVAHDVPTSEVLEKLLVPLRTNDPEDSLRFFTIRLQVQRFLEAQPNDKCTVYLMRPDTESERTLDRSGKIEAYQGANPGTGYKGDRLLYDEGKLTIQIHRYSEVKDRPDRTGKLLASDVPQIAVILPTSITKDVVVQDQGMTQ